MQISKDTFRKLINNFNFKELFVELGWDNYNDKQPQISIKDETYSIEAISEKRGFVILKCLPDSNGKIPVYSIRKQIENKISKHHHEHLLIFTDAAKHQQIWQLTIREEGKPTLTRETKYFSHQAPELIYQKLSGLFFSWDDEENISIVDVKRRVKENFNKNSEKVTKKFYQEFKKNHTAFIEFIEGISEKIDKDWYASLMLNRLMFIYFIQKKGFLDDNKNYLTDKLKQTKVTRGEDEFYSFYQDFLKILFHKGLGAKERNDEIIKEIGKVPYLNGGLFDVHELENKYINIKIKDDAFEKLFAFFDEYEWHLDTRKESTGKEINPDVIGYIFEKYINDRAAMGAYYTKPDITEYIGKNTIIPFIFDEVKRHYPKAFKPDEYIWQMLSLSSAKYIYDAVKFGIPSEGDIFADLPEEIRAGFRPDIEDKIVTDSEATHLFEIRKVWNKKAPADIALPTEIYRELIERRKRYADVKAKIENGEITQINDFITYNLNIRQFIQDIIADTDDPFLIKHFYDAIKKVTILDPTCGSGAFLFAALNILEPLYEGCINRMQQFTEENPNKYKKFEEILADVNSPKHPNLRYFIYKSIILNNLFGVDIMNEAVEIAKLRLFLKLVSTADVDYQKVNYGLEPLPDIDFNIRCGNTLVGFASESDFKKAVESVQPLFAPDIIKDFEDEFNVIAKAFKRFQDVQLIPNLEEESHSKAKSELQERLKNINDKLNEYLSSNYGISDRKSQKKKYEKWLVTHQPFHWLSEFYEIMSSSGFDVIIGNPPYVEYSKVKNTYNLFNYDTLNCGNLYVYVMERSMLLINHKSFIGLIMPISSICTDRMQSYQQMIKNCIQWHSLFAERPNKLFTGAEVQLVISLLRKTNKEGICYTTNYNKWEVVYRDFLFSTIHYTNSLDFVREGSLPKIGKNIEKKILQKIENQNNSLINYRIIKSKYFVNYRNAGGRYYKIALNFEPVFLVNSINKRSSTYKFIYCEDIETSNSICAIMNSSIFFWYWLTFSDTWHMINREIDQFSIKLNPKMTNVLNKITKELMDNFNKNSNIKIEKRNKGKDTIQFQQFFARYSKHIIDEIDTVLAQHYGFTEAELDFIINYDIKYRMGKELEAYIEGRLEKKE